MASELQPNSQEQFRDVNQPKTHVFGLREETKEPRGKHRNTGIIWDLRAKERQRMEESKNKREMLDVCSTAPGGETVLTRGYCTAREARDVT